MGNFLKILGIFFIFGLLLFIIAIIYLIVGIVINSLNLVITLILILFSVTFVFMGIMGTYISKIHSEVKSLWNVECSDFKRIY